MAPKVLWLIYISSSTSCVPPLTHSHLTSKWTYNYNVIVISMHRRVTSVRVFLPNHKTLIYILTIYLNCDNLLDQLSMNSPFKITLRSTFTCRFCYCFPPSSPLHLSRHISVSDRLSPVPSELSRTEFNTQNGIAFWQSVSLVSHFKWLPAP